MKKYVGSTEEQSIELDFNASGCTDFVVLVQKPDADKTVLELDAELEGTSTILFTPGEDDFDIPGIYLLQPSMKDEEGNSKLADTTALRVYSRFT